MNLLCNENKCRMLKILGAAFIRELELVKRLY